MPLCGTILADWMLKRDKTLKTGTVYISHNLIWMEPFALVLPLVKENRVFNKERFTQFKWLAMVWEKRMYQIAPVDPQVRQK